MKEVSAIYEYSYGWGEASLYGICLDIDRAKELIKELNKPHEEECKIQEMCSQCYGEDREEYENNPYKLRNTCPRASIKEDRNGEYCENELISMYDMTTTHFSCSTIKVVE
jgi:hypothetical protein